MVAAVLNPSGDENTTLPAIMGALRDHTAGGLRAFRRKLAVRFNPPAGRVTVTGFDTVRQPEQVKARLGYMPQNFGLYGDLSVMENLAFSADVFGLKGPARAKRIDELLDFANLGQFRSRRAGLLSGGMKKKLALACALLHRPEVLLLDEPTTGVDPVARRDFWDLLSGLHAEGITTVVSTPYMDEAERCNRAALLFEGRLMASGTPASIKKQVPGQVLALRGADVRMAQAALEGLPGLLDAQTYGNQLNLIVQGDVDDAAQRVRERLAGSNLAVESLEPVPVRMEEAFIYLVSAARQAAGGAA
jgi:ABC-2 type transport system ATP-binding protein